MTSHPDRTTIPWSLSDGAPPRRRPLRALLLLGALALALQRRHGVHGGTGGRTAP